MYETANIFLMVYNADDRDSFDKLNSILLDFKDSNAVGAYKVLVSVMNYGKDRVQRPREVSVSDVTLLMEQHGIPSYIEVRLDNKKNISILD